MMRHHRTPKALAALIGADMANIGRDPLLAGGVFLSLLPPALLFFFAAALDQFGLEHFGYPALSGPVTTVALMLPSGIVGWIFGFLLIEDRDNNVLLAIEITPLRKSGFIAYRLTLAFALTLLVLLAHCAILLPDASPGLSVGLAILASLHTLTTCLVLVGFAANKVEGLALTKLLNVAILLPLLALAPAPLRWVAGLLPPFWIGELLALGPAPLPYPLALLLGLSASALILTLLYRRATKRLG